MKRYASCLFMVLALSGFVEAQAPKAEPEAIRSTRELLRLMESEIETRDFRNEIKLSELTEVINDRLKAAGKPEIQFHWDHRAFQEFNDVQPGELLVKMERLPARLSIRQLLKRAVASIEVPTEMLVRGGQVDVLPQEHTGKQYLLNRRVDAEYDNQPLSRVLEDLADQAGLTVVLDPRAKDKAKTAMTVRFRGDVAVQDAIRMVSEMADLKLVHFASGLYVTTPDHAAKLQKELREIYDAASSATSPVLGLGAAPPPSPLVPPAPPPTPPQRMGGI
jgi:hypothetical protein